MQLTIQLTLAIHDDKPFSRKICAATRFPNDNTLPNGFLLFAFLSSSRHGEASNIYSLCVDN